MATGSQAGSERMYSWWWDSHISPKNSKWLQENLTDMDVKVKQMIKLIEEDADSFARRAEMYYKKRPELMNLVEEFYRAYRALAERYDHATRALRHAHRTMAEAFSNHVPFVLADDSPARSAADGDPRTPDIPPMRALIDPDELQKEALGLSSSHSPAVKRGGAFTDEPDSVTGRKGLKQLNALFGSGEGLNHAKPAEGRARKGLNFHDAEEKAVHDSDSQELRARVPSESERVSKAELEIVKLKNALSKLEAEKEAGLLQYQQTLERLSNLESEASCAKEECRGLGERARKAEAEVQNLKEALNKIDTEREASFLQYQQCLDKIANLENNISHAQKDAGELNDRASKAEIEAQSLKHDLDRLEAEKEASLLQYNLCLENISDLEEKLLHADADARNFKEQFDNAEREVEALKQALAKVTEEKEAAAARYQQCSETIVILEHKLACAQEDAQRLNSEVDDGVVKLKCAEERCVLLERSNQTMHTELETLAQKMAAQSEELTEKQKELGRLWTCLQEERLRFMDAETAFQTLQHLHSQSQDELRSMAAQLQTRSQISENLEACNQSLQVEFEQVKVENKGLTEVNLSSTLTIQNLQEEISSLRETISKLEEDVELRVDERNALQQEIYCLKEELNDLSKKHQAIMGQVESTGFSPECFKSSVKGLQDENLTLKEVFERERTEKVAILGKLEIMQKLLEKNSLLENSLSDINVELEGVREKVKALEESCQSLLREKSTLVSEKVILTSELQISNDNLEKLTEKNNILEKSLLDTNAELEKLRLKLKSLEDLCLLHENEKSDLVTAKGSLISQLDIAQKRLEDLVKNYAGLEEKYFGLENEKDSTLHELEKLRVCLDAEKQEHASLSQLTEAQLAVMASQIRLLQEESQWRKKEYEEELDRVLHAQIDIFILQKCARDLEEGNLSLLLEYKKLLEASKLSEKRISILKKENLEQQMEMKSLIDQIKFLRLGLYQVSKTLDLGTDQCGDEAKQEQTLLNHVLNKLQETQEVFSKVQDENHELVIGNSIFVTLLEQLQVEVANLVTTKNNLDQELKSRFEKSLVLQTECQKHAELNGELRLKIIEGNHREEELKAELNNLEAQLSDTQVSYQILYKENCEVLDDRRSLVKSVSDLRMEKRSLEEEHCCIFAESISQSTLCLILWDIVCEKSMEIKELTQNLVELCHNNDGHMERVKILEGMLDELSVIENERIELQKTLEDLKCQYDGVMLIRADQEKQIINLSADYGQKSKEAECTHEANQRLQSELLKLREEFLEIISREESFSHELLKRSDEVELWESQATSLFGELQMSAVRDSLFEGKVQELNQVLESLEDGNCSKAIEIDQLKQRVGALEGRNAELEAQMIAYGPAFISLRDCITSLENHTLSDVDLHGVDKEVKDGVEVVHAGTCQWPSEDPGAVVPDGFFDLKELPMRIRAIEKAVMEKERLAMLETLNANSKLEAAMGEIEEFRSRSRLHQGVIEIGKHVNPKSEDKKLGAMPYEDLRLLKRTHDLPEGNEMMTKDILLDQASECSSYGISRRETIEADDQMLEIWETAHQDGNIDLTVGKAQKLTADKKHNRENLSTESLIVKEVGVDKLEISKRFSASSQEGYERKILERLDSDAQKLTNLQITVQDLKKKVEITEKSKKGNGIEYDNVKDQLDESEGAIMKWFDVNRKLVKSIEDYSLSSDEKSAIAPGESGGGRRRKVFEQARRASEKIGRLQLQVQNLQFLLMKLNDENKSRGKAKITGQQTRVLLRDYLYGGTRTSHRRRKRHFCACVQPPTKGD